MKTLTLAAIRSSLMLTAVAALSLGYPASVQAVPTTYQYTGNHFIVLSGPAYTTSMFITGTVTLAAQLSPNFGGTFGGIVTPTAFRFFDGVQTLTQTQVTSSLFRFQTDATGNIIGWHAELTGQNTGLQHGSIFTRSIARTHTPRDIGSFTDANGFLSTGSTGGHPRGVERSSHSG